MRREGREGRKRRLLDANQFYFTFLIFMVHFSTPQHNIFSKIINVIYFKSNFFFVSLHVSCIEVNKYHPKHVMKVCHVMALLFVLFARCRITKFLSAMPPIAYLTNIMLLVCYATRLYSRYLEYVLSWNFHFSQLNKARRV